MAKKRNLDKYDHIVLNDEQAEYINSITEGNFINEPLLFINEGVLTMFAISLYFKNIDKKDIDLGYLDEFSKNRVQSEIDKNQILLITYHELYDNNQKHRASFHVFRKKSNVEFSPVELGVDVPKRIIEGFYASFIGVSNLLSNIEKENINIVSKSVKKNGRSKSNTKRRRVITIATKKYVYEKSDSKKQINRVTESWGVCGHWRKYKSGKRIWVNPYTKGTGNREPKQYKVGDIEHD
jgi:hypothetical protein